MGRVICRRAGRHTDTLRAVGHYSKHRLVAIMNSVPGGGGVPLGKPRAKEVRAQLPRVSLMSPTVGR